MPKSRLGPLSSRQDRHHLRGTAALVAFARIATGIVLALVAIYGVDSKGSGALFGLSVALTFRMHRPTLRSCFAACAAIILFVATFAVIDLRVVRTLWPSEHGTSVASVIVIGHSCRTPRRGDVVAWQLEDSASPTIAIDRVLALPGETLIVGEGRMHLSDGQHAEAPVAGVRSHWLWSISPNNGEFAAIPSTVAWRLAGPDPIEAESQAVAEASLVSEHQVIGRAVLVRHGWGQWRRP